MVKVYQIFLENILEIIMTPGGYIRLKKHTKDTVCKDMIIILK